MKQKYWNVYEYNLPLCCEEDKRRIYTFDNEAAAHDLVEFLHSRDFFKNDLGVEEAEIDWHDHYFEVQSGRKD